ncbi:MAG: pantetheine-phosphate adenylyltransferase [Coriobacteriales bacterium]|nr:pantetheine-phosphate adenylyltransferase [Coriobacteriales bacterium]
MKKVLVPGTFDPITLGHLDVIERSCKLFDSVYVGVAASHNKGGGPLFSLDERVALCKQACADFGLENVEVIAFDKLLVDFAGDLGVSAIVKGLRVTTDFEYEFQQAALNYSLESDLDTLFVMSNPQHMYISSSVAKEIASYNGALCDLVPSCVEEALRARFA